MVTEYVRPSKFAVLALAKTYAQARGLSLSTVSTYANGGGRFLKELEKPDVDCKTKTAVRLVQWFSDHWPDDDLPWPSDIPRPPHSKERRVA